MQPSNGISRRRAFAIAAQTAGWLALGSRLQPAYAGETPRFRIGACEWSLRKGDPSSLEVAQRIGLEGIQVNMGNVGNDLHLRKPDVQKAYVEASKRTGVALASLGIAEMNNVPLKSDPRAEQWLADSIDVARALGVRVILVAQFFKGDLKGDVAGTDHTVEVLKRHAPRAEKEGVVFGLENYLSAEENLAILDRVGSPAVQVYYDVGNSTDKGYDIYKEIRMLKGRVCEFHAKDGKFMLGQGRVDFRRVRQAMDEIDYRGWIQIEAAAPKELVADYSAHREFLRGVFKPT